MLVVAVVMLTVGCGADTVEASITFDGGTCSSSDVSRWPSGALDIAVSNGSGRTAAVVVGTYFDGYGQADLEAYGSDISTRPDFIEALEIFQVGPGSSQVLAFGPGPGTYFMVCLPDTNTMVVLDDLVIEG